MKRISVAATASIGGCVGTFWLYAIDAGMNGAQWPPNWRSWPAYVTCPFIPLVGLSSFANICVPLLNAFAYGVLFVGIRKIWSVRGTILR